LAFINPASSMVLGYDFPGCQPGESPRRQTKKRQPPVKLPPRLLAHMRRWAAHGLARKTVVEWNGKSVESVRLASIVCLSVLTRAYP
jgi:hypothetical protein